MSKETRYVIRSHKIDPFTTVRKRVILTPDRCRICGFSICERNGLPSFEQHDKAGQLKIKEALAKHRALAHPMQHKPVVGESELPKQWLGGQPDDPNIVERPRAQVEQLETTNPVPNAGWAVNKRKTTGT